MDLKFGSYFETKIFEPTLSETESLAWNAFVEVVKNFLGNTRAENYCELVNDMLEKFKNTGCRMSLKMHFLHSRLDFFPQKWGC